MSGFKDQLLRVSRLLGISPSDFTTVGIHAWPSILGKIERTFVQKTSSNIRFNWWWESFKEPHYRLSFKDGRAYSCFELLFDPHEQVWFVACDSTHDPSKLWLFQGTIMAIKQLLHEHTPFEYYVVSKKYAWLVCETAQYVLYGLGNIIPKLRALETDK